eukprot:3591855-Heterocapsa_arctica.AAC.1
MDDLAALPSQASKTGTYGPSTVMHASLYFRIDNGAWKCALTDRFLCDMCSNDVMKVRLVKTEDDLIVSIPMWEKTRSTTPCAATAITSAAAASTILTTTAPLLATLARSVENALAR